MCVDTKLHSQLCDNYVTLTNNTCININLDRTKG